MKPLTLETKTFQIYQRIDAEDVTEGNRNS